MTSLLAAGTRWRTRAPSLVPALGLVGVTIAITGLVVAWRTTSYDIWGALLVGPALVLVTVPLARRAARIEADPTLAHIVLVALVCKLVGSLARYAVAFDLYDGAADAGRYDAAGKVIAAGFRAGTFDLGAESVVGTRFVEILTGVVYTVIGPTRLGGFLVFAWIGFWGLYLCVRAFRIAVPEGDHRRYALLTFFLPSLLFWSSSIGKEAWMTFGIGLTALGTARLLRHRRGGFAVVALGLWATAMVRPHVTLLLVVALGAAYALRRSDRLSLAGPFAKAVGCMLLLVAATVVVARAESFLGLDALNPTTAADELERTAANTAQGGSQFVTTRPSSPLGLPSAVLTVLFRPFPWEASNAQSLVAALEATGLLLLSAASISRIVRAPAMALRRPYVALAVVFTLGFVYAFSAVENFGILTRQRVQVLPLFLVLVALPRAGAPPAGQTVQANSTLGAAKGASRPDRGTAVDRASAP